MNSAKQRFCSTTLVYQIICNSLYWTVQFIWSLSYLKVLSNDYFWVNWSTIDSLNHLFNVPSVFCQKSSFGRFLIFWFHSFGNWYPLAFLFNWALYYCFEFLYALVLKIICILENYCVTFMLYRIDSYRHMYILLFRICFRYVPIPVSFLWTLNSSNLLIELSYMWLLGFHMCPCFQFLSNLNILVKDYCLLRIDS